MELGYFPLVTRAPINTINLAEHGDLARDRLQRWHDAKLQASLRIADGAYPKYFNVAAGISRKSKLVERKFSGAQYFQAREQGEARQLQAHRAALQASRREASDHFAMRWLWRRFERIQIGRASCRERV